MNFSETIASAKSVFKDTELHSLLLRWFKLNRWGIIFIIFFSSVFSVFYIANIMNVNETLSDLRKMKKYHENLIHKNKLLLSKIERLESSDRISYIAEQKLGMVKSEKAPKILNTKK